MHIYSMTFYFRTCEPVKWSEVAKSGKIVTVGCAAYETVRQHAESHDYISQREMNNDVPSEPVYEPIPQ